jgi:hypothetical protein
MEEDMHEQNREISAELHETEPDIAFDEDVEGDDVEELVQYEQKVEETPPVKSECKQLELPSSDVTYDIGCSKEETPPVKSAWKQLELPSSDVTYDIGCSKEETPPVKSAWKQPIKATIKTEKKVLAAETTWKVVSNHGKSEPKQSSVSSVSLNKKPDRLNTVTSLKWFFFKDTKKGPILPKATDWFLWDARNIAEETEKPILIPIGWQRVEGFPWTYRVNDKSRFMHYLNESMEWEHYEVFDNNTTKIVSNEYLRYAQTPISMRYNMVMPAN